MRHGDTNQCPAGLVQAVLLRASSRCADGAVTPLFEEAVEMKLSSLLRTGSMLVLVGAAACADSIPVAPGSVLTRVSASASVASSDENVTVSPVLAQMNEQLAASGANLRIAKAEVLIAADG